MPNLNIIRQDLLAARSELEEEVATLDRVLQALHQPIDRTQTKSQEDTRRPPSRDLMESVSKAVRNSPRPISNTEIAARIGKSNRSTGRALTFLKKEGKVAYERNDMGQVHWKWENG